MLHITEINEQSSNNEIGFIILCSMHESKLHTILVRLSPWEEAVSEVR